MTFIILILIHRGKIWRFKNTSEQTLAIDGGSFKYFFCFHPDLWGRWAKLTTNRFFKFGLVQPPASWNHLQKKNRANVFLDDHLVPSDSVQKGGIPANNCKKKTPRISGDPKMEVQKPRFFRYFAGDFFIKLIWCGFLRFRYLKCLAILWIHGSV